MANVLKNCCVLSMLFSIAAFSCTPAQNNFSRLKPDVCIDIEPPRIAPSVTDTIVPPPPPPPQDDDDIGCLQIYDSLKVQRQEKLGVVKRNIENYCRTFLDGFAVIQFVIEQDGDLELEDLVHTKGYDEQAIFALRNCIEKYFEEEKPNVGPVHMKRTARSRSIQVMMTLPLGKP